MQTGFEQNCFNPSQLPQMQFLHRFVCLGAEVVQFLMLVLNVGNMQASAFPNLRKQHLSCPETNHPMQLSASWKSAWIWSHLPLSPVYKYQRPEQPILGNSRPFGPISQAFYRWLESQTFFTHRFSQLLQKSSYTCSTPQSDSMCLAQKSYQNWSKDKGIRVPYWERRVT